MIGNKLYVGNLHLRASGEAERARKALDGTEFLERVIRVR